jgi:protein-S-isoprenylcysteine O-methyltransferase Ste14
MVLAFLLNLAVCFLDPLELVTARTTGKVVLFLGWLFFLYVCYYLRMGLMGEVEPNLDHLVTEGPYRFCRHPLYLSFVLVIMGFDLVFGSLLGILCTLFLAIPSTIYRARLEEKALADRFGEEWEGYKEKTRF